ncbi:Superoxide dismutase 1 copper chaperone [Ceratocystis lukuohia]|uniref:Superoxide dismutase 1 copper chaperone n=1 Tax=Ceratocystis lukuohia TaxID=2019550 RepID=A0ABR4MT57_9PEZI
MTISEPIQVRAYDMNFLPMVCEACVKSVSESIYNLGGITNVNANLKDQQVLVEGTAAPSAIVSAIQATGRDAILRGSGASDICILESFETEAATQPVPEDGRRREVRGLARMVQGSSSALVIDLTIHGVEPGLYRATIREYGDLEAGVSSTGLVWGSKENPDAPRGFISTVTVDESGKGAVYVDKPLQVWELIGHAMVLTRQGEEKVLENDANTVVGVIARSAGMWDNDKMVCSCTGKTLWEERKDEVKKGML